MKDIKLVDITLHIDKDPNDEEREFLEHALRRISGVVSVHMPEEKSHLVMVEYDPEQTESEHILTMVRKVAGHTEMIGL